jgi:hypothetical protein
MKLDESQERALYDLRRKLATASAKLAQSQAGEPDFANTFGILGPRGAGKSTLLRWLDKPSVLPKYPLGTGENEALGRLLILPPIDCSVIPLDVAPGAAILLHIQDQLSQQERSPKVKELCKRLSGLAERYSETTVAYRKLGLELASSAGDYTHFVLSEMSRRFHLQDDLRDWLKDALDEINHSACLVLLDDFDLVDADEVRKWILSLLDELHQRRLLIVLTADYYRLEHLSFSPRSEFDDKTGRALLDKLLPSQNRCNLERWELTAREKFRLVDPSGGADRDLSKLLDRYSLASAAQTVLLLRLLPGWPRGLVNLYQTLTSEQQAGNLPESRDVNRDTTLQSFLSLLASCRGEPLLARKLMSTQFSAWRKILHFGSQDLVVEEWQEIVEVAVGRAGKKEDEGKGDMESNRAAPRRIRPFPLFPVPPLQGKRGRNRKAILQASTLAAPWFYDPSEPDRLRHDDLRVLPLLDAQESVRPFWSELLLNYSFLACAVGDKADAVRNRVHFLQTWTPAESRLMRARLRVKLTRSALRDFFEDPRARVPRSCLLWMSWSAGDEPPVEVAVEIGWHPLFAALRGARDPLLSEQLADLLIGTSNFEGDMPKGGDVEALALIPDQLWAMILLIDGLDRCPWSALSAPLGWLLRTYVQLAAALVRTAYVFALEASGALQNSELSKSQQKFLEILKSRDPLELLALKEEEVLSLMTGLFIDNLVEKVETITDSLSTASRAYLNSPVYNAAAKLSTSARVQAGSARPVGRKRAQ